ncbi:MAG: tetratricopeptide repeat protein [Rubrivivax sp.]|nr:tetratricopeptide repeat protein [Rubrivivax sp.]MDP3222776.1 tetratricopeptide repeat protein [Rubrivivax sp.]MDP3615669.1 tetratricopeptide repeat protein [Rubrivivax sp.]
MKHTALVTASLLAALAHLAAQAADTTPEPPPPSPSYAPVPQPLAAAQAHIKASHWLAAIDELKRVNATGDADWNNLMGYSLRKQSRPDLDGAQKHYDAALRIKPQHQGALEYAGELALMKRDLATAEKHLATLSRLCSSPCEPLDDLKAAVASYKAANK